MENAPQYDVPQICIRELGTGRDRWFDISDLINDETKLTDWIDGEEYIAVDYDGFPNVGEHVDFERLGMVLDWIDEHGFDFARFVLDNNLDPSCFDSIVQIDTWLDYATELFDECYEVPENIQPYIDYDAFARDLGFDYLVDEALGYAIHAGAY